MVPAKAYFMAFAADWKESVTTYLRKKNILVRTVWNVAFVLTNLSINNISLKRGSSSVWNATKITKITNTASYAWNKFQASGFSATKQSAINGSMSSVIAISKKKKINKCCKNLITAVLNADAKKEEKYTNGLWKS